MLCEFYFNNSKEKTLLNSFHGLKPAWMQSVVHSTMFIEHLLHPEAQDI